MTKGTSGFYELCCVVSEATVAARGDAVDKHNQRFDATSRVISQHFRF